MMVLQSKIFVLRIMLTLITAVSSRMGVTASFTSEAFSIYRPQNFKQVARTKQDAMLYMYASPKSNSNTIQYFPITAINLYSTVTFGSSFVSSDTIPSFRAAQGLLSPQTVLRLESRITKCGISSPGLRYFLKTYHTHGPMACLPILSNPDVLLELTRVMRDSSRDTDEVKKVDK